tara:strand:- start:765 stop:1085 length:321 start_codon:yes stop_codon:yes gene_type:complete
MQETCTPDSPATDLNFFEVGKVYYANVFTGKAFITVTGRDTRFIDAIVDLPQSSEDLTVTLPIHRHSNANGVMTECLNIMSRLAWADLDASTVFGEEWVACYLNLA